MPSHRYPKGKNPRSKLGVGSVLVLAAATTFVACSSEAPDLAANAGALQGRFEPESFDHATAYSSLWFSGTGEYQAMRVGCADTDCEEIGTYVFDPSEKELRLSSPRGTRRFRFASTARRGGDSKGLGVATRRTPPIDGRIAPRSNGDSLPVAEIVCAGALTEYEDELQVVAVGTEKLDGRDPDGPRDSSSTSLLTGQSCALFTAADPSATGSIEKMDDFCEVGEDGACPSMKLKNTSKSRKGVVFKTLRYEGSCEFLSQCPYASHKAGYVSFACGNLGGRQLATGRGGASVTARTRQCNDDWNWLSFPPRNEFDTGKSSCFQDFYVCPGRTTSCPNPIKATRLDVSGGSGNDGKGVAYYEGSKGLMRSLGLPWGDPDTRGGPICTWSGDKRTSVNYGSGEGEVTVWRKGAAPPSSDKPVAPSPTPPKNTGASRTCVWTDQAGTNYRVTVKDPGDFLWTGSFGGQPFRQLARCNKDGSVVARCMADASGANCQP